jgi:phage host-nuclease inhibitor protein Gam
MAVKTPRTKPQPLIIADATQADEALRQLAEIAREQERIKNGMNDQIDQLKAAAQLQQEPLNASRKRLEEALAVFAIQRKDELFSGRKRSLELVFGVIGFRKATSLRLMAKHTWAQVLGRLQDLNLVRGIRTKLEVDKDELRTWPDERLEALGVRLDCADEFYLELKQEDLQDAA